MKGAVIAVVTLIAICACTGPHEDRGRQAEAEAEFASFLERWETAQESFINGDPRVQTGAQSEASELALRVTQIFRREDGSWKLLHRHADPTIEKKAP